MIQASKRRGLKALYWLSDVEWARIEPLMPRGRRGAHRVDDRRVISGIVYMLRSGVRWRDCPAAWVPMRRSTTASTDGAGIWFEMFERLNGSSGITDSVAIDNSTIKVHRSAGGGKGGRSNRLPHCRRDCGLESINPQRNQVAAVPERF
jgi:transposase